jgi:hypothetical protein
MTWFLIIIAAPLVLCQVALFWLTHRIVREVNSVSRMLRRFAP